MKRISLLGSTGSIGTQTLQVIEHLNLKVVALSAYKNVDLLEQQVRKFKPEMVCIFNENYYNDLKLRLADCSVKIVSGIIGLSEVASLSSANFVFNATSGISSLLPILTAINDKKTIALANKEIVVVGGELIFNCAKENGVDILPVDSEHSAIFQCLNKNKANEVDKIILTASGGPFFNKKTSQLQNVTIEEALNHPKWKMGAQITIDSATLMNKGFELIEACHFFQQNPNNIEVIIHPQACLHSAVSYCDGSVIGHFSATDMKIPIQFALTYPNRNLGLVNKFSFLEFCDLHFYKPDNETFIGIELCRNAIKKGGLWPTVIYSANELAVNLFLEGKIKFLDIYSLIKQTDKIKNIRENVSVMSILETVEMVKSFLNDNIQFN